MASRGQRAVIIDGSDYTTRERFAQHLQMSFALKSKINRLNTVHLLIWVLLTSWVTLSHFGLVSHNTLPSPYLWEYPYLLSIIPTILNISAVLHNNKSHLVIFMLSGLLFGVAPLIYGNMEMFPVAQQQEKVCPFLFAVKYLMNIVAMLVYSLQFYYSKKLLNLWHIIIPNKMK